MTGLYQKFSLSKLRDRRRRQRNHGRLLARGLQSVAVSDPAATDDGEVGGAGRLPPGLEDAVRCAVCLIARHVNDEVRLDAPEDLELQALPAWDWRVLLHSGRRHL